MLGHHVTHAIAPRWKPTLFTPQQLLDTLLQNTPQCPQETKHAAPQPMRWQFFTQLLASSKPTKAAGLDRSNLYIFHICSQKIQESLWNVCNRFLHSPMPRQCTTALIFLLYKKKEVTDPRNYRPTSLLHSIYKIIATRIREQLAYHVDKHKIMYNSQHGGLAAHRTADHIYHIKALQIKSKQAYH